MTGWIKIHRTVLDHPMFDGRADKLGAWVMLIAKANHVDGGTLARGEYRASIKRLAQMFGWTDKRVRNFMAELVENGMITWDTEGAKKGTKGALISVCNYSKYQSIEADAGTKGAQKGQHSKKKKEEEDNTLPHHYDAPREEVADAVADGMENFCLEKACRDAAGMSISQREFVPGLNDLGDIRQLLREKFSLENQILPIIRHVASRHRGQPITSWKYFANAIRNTCSAGGEPVALTPKEKTEALIAQGVHPLTAARRTGLVVG